MTSADAELERLREENAKLRARVAKLRKRTDAEGLDYLFILTYGRSGSTLVSGLLNRIPGYLIRGENLNAVHHLFQWHTKLVEGRAKGPAAAFRTPTHPFFGIGDVPLDKSIDGARRLALDTVLRPLADTRVTGFKEIRWYATDMPAYTAWLREVFPGARFLVNTRAQADVLKSKWWATGTEEERAHKAAHLADVEARILACAEGLGEAAYRVHYDDFVADPTVLRGMYDWLGEPWDEAAVRATLEVRHSV